jgi:FixJ family two-component response regulator
MSAEPDIIYIVDDEPGMRKALCRLLRAEGFDARAFASPRDFLAGYDAESTACLLLDVAMPELDGMEFQQLLAQRGLQIPIVFLTAHGDIPMSVRAVKAGATDFLTKPVNDADLLRAVRAALKTAAKLAAEQSAHKALATRHATLTPREKEVMALVVKGMLNKQIAAQLGTGEQNIKIHRSRVMAKMGVLSLADLVRAAERLEGGNSAGV